MRVAPIDIANKTFGRKMFGLDTEEVYDFLRDVADEMEAMGRAQEQLEQKLKDQEKALEGFREREETLKQTLQTASQMSEKMKAEAHRESDLIIKESRQRGEIIIKEARESLRSMYQDINDLKKSRMQFEAGLKSLVKAHLAMIDQGHSVVPDPQVMKETAPAAEAPKQKPAEA
ncbi:MAG: DivIVA domain-containing protein [Bdellovibrionales bacterium]|nr:DivIVA domain-containing protein [Bdellovibrionales bacterium]NQZ17805.1 DivIVA domain-containing protein [Bdellovibrionales bacterium]